MSYQYAPECPMFKNDGSNMTQAELLTYYGAVEAHYGPAAQCYRLAELQWDETGMQKALVLDQYGNPAQGVEVTYRLADGGEAQHGFTDSSGRVTFTIPDAARYNVTGPSTKGPMAIFVNPGGDHDSVLRCGSVNVRGGNDRTLTPTFRWGTVHEYDQGSTPPPVQPPIDRPGLTQIEVIDFNGNPATWAWLESVFGPDVFVEPKGDWECFRLLAKTGPSSIVTTVQDPNGYPVPGVGVACDWPDGVANGVTDGAGAWGFAMGRGSYYHPENGEHGIHNIWLTSVASDIVHNLGMLGGTPHDHLEPWFRPRTAPIPPQPPEDIEPIIHVEDAIAPGAYKLVRL